MMNEFTIGTMYWVNPLASLDEVKRDMADMRANGISLIRIIAWWELIEEKAGLYDFSHIDRVFRAAEQENLCLMPTIGFYPPMWLAKKLDMSGMNDPGRYPVVMRQEIQQPLSKLIEKLVKRYSDSPALEMWNIWNEPTVNPTVSRFRLDRFAAWLRERYKSWDDLRQAWRGEYPVFSLLLPDSMDALTGEWLNEAFLYGTRGRNSVIRYDWLIFLTDELNAEAHWLREEIKKYDAQHPIHANLHSLSGNPLPDGRDLFALARVLDTVSCSIHTSNDYPGGKEFYAPIWNYSFGVAQCYSWSKGRKHSMVGELQAGTTDTHCRKYTPEPYEIRYELSFALGEGLDGVIFWLWRGWKAGTFELAEFSLRNPSDGSPTARSEEVRIFSEKCREYQDILKTMKRPKSRAAILYSQSSCVYRTVLEQDRPFGLRNEHSLALFGCFRALQEANYQVDFVSEKEIQDGVLNDYSVLYMPMSEVVGKKSARAIGEFVKNGGNLYADGRSGWLDEHMYLRGEVPGNGLAEIFGASESDYVMGKEDSAVTLGGTKIYGTRMMQKLRPADGVLVSGFFADGSAAVVDHTFGKGRARLAGSGFCRRLYDYPAPETAEWIASFARESGIEPEIELPPGITAKHLIGTEYDLWIFHNHGSEQMRVALPVQGSVSASFFGTKIDSESFILPTNGTEIFLIRITN